MLKALALRPAAARVLGAKAGVVAGPLAALGFSSQQRSFRAPQLEHGQRAMSSVVQKANAGGSLDAGGGLGGTSGVSKRTDRKCTLVLEDGSVFSGQSFGSEVCSPSRIALLKRSGGPPRSQPAELTQFSADCHNRTVP